MPTSRMLADEPRPARTTSSLNTSHNDTGRTAYCGPVVLSAITGYSVSKVEDAVRAHRAATAGTTAGDRAVRGTYAEDVESALAAYGYRMVQTETHLHKARKERPTVWSWMQKPRNAWAHYVLAVHKGKTGHWILIKGVKMCDTFTDGKWVFVCDGPHRGARIMEGFEVKKVQV